MHILIKQLEEDCRQYDELRDRYFALKSDDYAEAWEIEQLAWVLADRWNDIALQANQIALDAGYTKSDVSKWAYGRYRQMQEAQEHAQIVWSRGNKEANDIASLERWVQAQARKEAIRRGE